MIIVSIIFFIQLKSLLVFILRFTFVTHSLESHSLVEVDCVVPFEFDSLVLGCRCVVVVLQLAEAHPQPDLAQREIPLEVDGSRKLVEGAGILFGAQVDHAQILGHDPLEGVQLVGPLEAGHCCDELLLAVEAHGHVVPQLAAVRHRLGSDPLLEQCRIVIVVVLDDAPNGQNGAGIARVLRQRIAEVFKSLESFVGLQQCQA